jgi:hypothetical protein
MAGNSAPIVDRIRIIPRPNDFLDRNVGSSGEVFFSRDSNSLRVYSGKDRAGFEIARTDLVNVSDDTLSTRIAALGISGSGASVDVGVNPPDAPEAGNLWLNTNNGRLYIYVDDGDTTQWIQPAVPSFSGDYNDLTNKPVQPTLATVATSGSYTDLLNLPALSAVALSNDYNDLTNLPTLSTVSATGSFGDILNTPTTLSGYGITDAATSAQGTLADSAVQPADLTTSITTLRTTDQTITGNYTFQGITELYQTRENIVSQGSIQSPGVNNHDVSSGAVFYHDLPAEDFTPNFLNIPTTNGKTTSVVLIINQDATPRMPTTIQIEGVATTVNWLSGTAPSGNASQVDALSLTLIRLNDTWTVLGSSATYG